MKETGRYRITDFDFWKITISLALASFFVFAALYAVQPLLPVFVDTFGVSVSVSSLALSMVIIGLIIGLIVFGFLSDRLGRTFLIKASLLGSVVPFLLIPLTNSFIILIILRFIQGLLLAGLPAASLAYISEEIESRSVGTATGFYISSNALGGMAGRVMTGYFTDHFSWETAFFILAAIGTLVVLIVYIMLPQSKFFEKSVVSIRTDLIGFFYHLKNPALLLMFGMGVVLQSTFTGMWTYLPFYLQGEPFLLSLQAISYMFLAYGFGVIGSPMAGSLSGKYGIKPVRVTGIIVLSGGVLLTIIPSLPMIMIGLCLSCLGFFTAHSVTAASISDQVTHHKGSASSLYLVAYYIGVSSGSTLYGPVWERIGWKGVIVIAGLIPVIYIGILQFFNKRNSHPS